MPAAEFGDIYRKNVWSIPIGPLREFITNALVHASYSRLGTPIKVAFLDQTIEIESPGGLMPNLTVEEMTQGVSVIRNPAIARVFEELGLIEKWGTGIPQAIQKLTDAGLPAPEFKELAASLRVIVHIKDHSVTPHVAADVVTDVVRDVASELTESEQQVLAILRAVGSAPAGAGPEDGQGGQDQAEGELGGGADCDRADREGEARGGVEAEGVDELEEGQGAEAGGEDLSAS